MQVNPNSVERGKTAEKNRQLSKSERRAEWASKEEAWKNPKEDVRGAEDDSDGGSDGGSGGGSDGGSGGGYDSEASERTGAYERARRRDEEEEEDRMHGEKIVIWHP